ncbi:outer membrane lipoprotein chaperone LolA [Colwellia echini]|uniref:Outer-membrane lipoprotein carrier protein n=1 Tax=Colwellia echini TaxID=1982103 RepID=A0ABY3MSP6_9GAMM|nr:outer membrane lipoprotein chaperone LolA [Colwellia echini]TYK64216.1 outer membrane lipoprotein chaperone LolA [Colwellia echini]
MQIISHIHSEFRTNFSTKCRLKIRQKFSKIALTSLLIPTLGFTQIVYAVQDTVNIEPSALISPSNTPSNSPSNKAKQHLMVKLSTLAFFSADFTQKILSEQGELLQQGSGNLAISKPNLANWKTITPDETLIVSDGNTLWFYDPFIEQASAFSLAKSIHNTPILLLTSDEPQLWARYDVLESDIAKDKAGNKVSRFVVIPKDESGQIKKLTLSFVRADKQDTQAELTQFSFQDATGQISEINLNNFNSETKPDDTLFTFRLPEGVRLEDKR